MAEQKTVIVNFEFTNKGFASVVDDKVSQSIVNREISNLNKDGFCVNQVVAIEGSDVLPDDKSIVSFTSGILLLAERT